MDGMGNQAQRPAFKLAMRGYDRQQVDEYLVRLAESPDLPTPDFALVMRGYDRDDVERYLRERA